MRLLLVDDDRSTENIMKSNTKWNSMNIDSVTAAHSVQEAKEIVQKENPDIAVAYK